MHDDIVSLKKEIVADDGDKPPSCKGKCNVVSNIYRIFFNWRNRMGNSFRENFSLSEKEKSSFNNIGLVRKHAWSFSFVPLHNK